MPGVGEKNMKKKITKRKEKRGRREKNVGNQKKMKMNISNQPNKMRNSTIIFRPFSLSFSHLNVLVFIFELPVRIFGA